MKQKSACEKRLADADRRKAESAAQRWILAEYLKPTFRLRLQYGGFPRKDSPADFDAIVEAYAGAFGSRRGLILTGGPGRGKSVAARALAGPGADVLPPFQRAHERAAGLAEAGERWKNRALIIDDFGAEALAVSDCSQTAVAELLYTLCDAAEADGGLADVHIVTTRLDFAQIRERYGERVASRLAEWFLHVPFVGPCRRGPADGFRWGIRE